MRAKQPITINVKVEALETDADPRVSTKADATEGCGLMLAPEVFVTMTRTAGR